MTYHTRHTPNCVSRAKLTAQQECAWYIYKAAKAFGLSQDDYLAILDNLWFRPWYA
jgi:hypothetical protein